MEFFFLPTMEQAGLQQALGLTNTFIHALAISGTNLYAGTEDGVFHSTNNGANWTAINNGLTNPTIFALACLRHKSFRRK